ncbi:MAG: hypothetical protein ACRYFX_05605 [Janthinobacterium lividum]
MPDFYPAATALHEALLCRLTLAGCQHGRFDVSAPGAHLSLSGQKPDGKTIFFWEFDRPFHKLVSTYLVEAHSQHTAQLTILIDVEKAEFQHTRTTRQQVAAAQQADEKSQHEARRNAPRDHTPYGSALAAQVAARLDQGATLAYSHRDYCGQGLSRITEGRYAYGSVWDGGLLPDRVFPDRISFINWLAAQSDYTLAGLESQDPWAWDNQTITRQRLEEFVQGR